MTPGTISATHVISVGVGGHQISAFGSSDPEELDLTDRKCDDTPGTGVAVGSFFYRMRCVLCTMHRPGSGMSEWSTGSLKW